MKLLAISDIHGKIDAVHRMRALEGNTFDALLIAGDIGSDLKTATKIFDVLTSFNCMILYVYGNWDHHFSYEHRFADNAHHLHNSCFTLDSFVFAGFSGVRENWGANPWVAPVKEALFRRQSISLDHIDGQIAAEEEELNILLTDNLKSYIQPGNSILASIRIRRQKLNVLRGKRTRLKAEHQIELDQIHKHIVAANRKALLNRMAAYSQNKTIVITHGRLARTVEDMPDVPLFLFGHVHGFTSTKIKKSRFINVSALDHIVRVKPEQTSEWSWHDIRSADVGAYTVIEIGRNGEIHATSHPMRSIPKGWRRIAGSPQGPWPLAHVDILNIDL